MMRLSPLESLLNRNIGSSAEARELCRRLDGKTLAVLVQGVPASLYFQAHDETVSITSRSDAVADATLSGTPLALLNLAGARPEAAVRGGSVQISGDAEVAQTFRDLLQQVRPDLEEELARLLGDVAAHRIGNVVRGALNFGRRTAHTFAQNVAEYLQEEGRDVPSRTEAEEFTAGVDQIRDDAERLQARLDLFEKRQSSSDPR